MLKQAPFFQKTQQPYPFAALESQRTDTIDMTIGDAKRPIPTVASRAMAAQAQALAHEESFEGYGPTQGHLSLRKAIAKNYYNGTVEPEEIFIHDGAKGEIARWAAFLQTGSHILLQNPTYPAYIDTLQMAGHTFDATLPEEMHLPPTPFDAIVLCAPHNPTGRTLTQTQWHRLLTQLEERNTLCFVDRVYAFFSAPEILYHYPKARARIIEIHSLSKSASFAGLRLGWTVVPQSVTYANGQPLLPDWRRFLDSTYNGTSSVVQAGALALFQEPQLASLRALCDATMEDTHWMRAALKSFPIPLTVSGGEHAPYLWVCAPGKTTDALVQLFLRYWNIRVTPGTCFGSGGAGYVRISCFMRRTTRQELTQRISIASP